MINLKYLIRRGMKSVNYLMAHILYQVFKTMNVNYLMAHILYQVFKTILIISSKNMK